MKSVDNAFERLKPELDDISMKIKHSHLGRKDRAGLAAMVAAHFFGVAGGAVQECDPDLADKTPAELAPLIAEWVSAAFVSRSTH